MDGYDRNMSRERKCEVGPIDAVIHCRISPQQRPLNLAVYRYERMA
jgi:hypothetical protein